MEQEGTDGTYASHARILQRSRSSSHSLTLQHNTGHFYPHTTYTPDALVVQRTPLPSCPQTNKPARWVQIQAPDARSRLQYSRSSHYYHMLRNTILIRVE